MENESLILAIDNLTEAVRSLDQSVVQLIDTLPEETKLQTNFEAILLRLKSIDERIMMMD